MTPCCQLVQPCGSGVSRDAWAIGEHGTFNHCRSPSTFEHNRIERRATKDREVVSRSGRLAAIARIRAFARKFDDPDYRGSTITQMQCPFREHAVGQIWGAMPFPDDLSRRFGGPMQIFDAPRAMPSIRRDAGEMQIARRRYDHPTIAARYPLLTDRTK
jgi:hypothetical protein